MGAGDGANRLTAVGETGPGSGCNEAYGYDSYGEPLD